MELIMVEVSNFTELKNAIEDSTSTEINVKANITFESGAKINVAKSNLVIDFNGFTVVDNNNLNFTDTIYVPSTTNTISVIVKNAVWSGRNYYGVVGVYNGNTNTTVELININYTGPQFMYNKNGTTIINNCTVVLDKNESSANPQEFCEANRLIIAGNVDVVSRSTSDSIIWFTGTNAALTVNENAVFTVNASGTYFLYTDVAPTMLFKQNSSTKITTKNGLFYAASSASHIAESFTLEENASFVAYKQTSNTVPMFKCTSNFTLKNNSTFNLYSEIIGSSALMYFSKTANIEITSPKSVVLYNRGSNIFSFQSGSASSPNVIKIETEMMRLWNVATTPLSTAGGFSDTPTTEFYKANYSQNLTATINATTSQLTSVENNLVSGDNSYPMTTSSLKLLTSNLISMGKIALSVSEVTDKSQSIDGVTDSGANVKLELDGTTNETTSSDNGDFSLALSSPLSVGTQIKLSVNKQFLTKTITIFTNGSVSITSISSLDFCAFTTNSNQSVIFRQNPNWSIEITDTRIEGDSWFLYAHILNPLSSNDATLDDALIYKIDGESYTLSEKPVLVYSGKKAQDNQITTIVWKNIEGFLLNIDTAKTYLSGDYQTNILWQITTQKLE